MNKEELIKWMTEKREGLTFESKVQLIKNFWDNKDAVKLFSEKYGKTDLNGVGELIEQKNDEIVKVQDQIKDKETELNTAQNAILCQKQTIADLKLEKEQNQQEITQKDDRIAQLEKLFKRTAAILQKQFDYNNNLLQKLDWEKNDKNISQEKATHLQEDINRLEQQKQELNARIKELDGEETESKKIKEEELKDLRTKLATSTQALADIQANDQQVYDILESESKKQGLLLRSQEVIQKIKDLRAEKDNIHQELQKEQGWWDKWINDKKTLFLAKSKDNFINFLQNDAYINLGTEWTDVFRRGGAFVRSEIRLLYKTDKQCNFDWTIENNERTHDRKRIKALLDYYKSFYI